jgi:hypothetical protein
MRFAWINDNVERQPADIYETVGLLAMIAGHPWKNLIRAHGPAPARARPRDDSDYVDGRLGIAIHSDADGMIVDLMLDGEPWFRVRQEELERCKFEVYDWGDYFGMSIQANGECISFEDAWNYSEHHPLERGESG